METNTCSGVVVGISCFSDGKTHNSTELEIRFLCTDQSEPRALHVSAGTAPQAFATFANLALLSYQHDTVLEIRTNQLSPKDIPVITLMRLPNKQ